MDRLAMLRKMVSARPDDPFARYGLAMELKKSGEHDEARRSFAMLIEHHPGYVPTYLMYGNFLLELGESEGAAAIFDRGIEAARTAGEDHALSELEAARAQL